MCPCPHQTRQVLAAPSLCSAKEQKRDSQQGHALGSSWSCVSSARRAVDVPHQPWLGAGLDGASSTCHPVAEALCSGCTQSRAAFFPEKPGLVLPETCSARTAQGGHRSSYWQLISERRGSGGRRQRGPGRGHGTSPSSPGARCWVGSSRGYMATGVSSCFLAIY